MVYFQYIAPIAIVLGLSQAAAGEDVFLTIGGGPDPQNNQVSLESNVLFLQRVLAAKASPASRQLIYFADGRLSDRDLKFIAIGRGESRAVQWMSRLFATELFLNRRFRDHRVRPVDGPATKEQVRLALERLADDLAAGDRLLVYVTAHGEPSAVVESKVMAPAALLPENMASERNTAIAMWGDELLRVQELGDWLDRFDTEVQVVLIMVQCYSGGFAETVFRESDRTLGLTRHWRVGFFSQIYDRASAGCTAEIDEADYQEYSSFFWAAVAGRPRVGSHFVDADYDRDGRVSFAEAHAYAVIHTDTLDIPVRTSGAALRRYSKLGDVLAKPDAEGGIGSIFGNLFGGDAVSEGDRAHGHLPLQLKTMAETVDDANQIARPDQLAIVRALTQHLQIDPADTTVEQLRVQTEQLTREIEIGYEKLDLAYINLETLRTELLDRIQEAHPEFARDTYSPIVSAWTNGRSEEFLTLIESIEESKTFLTVEQQIEEQIEMLSQQEKREAKFQRLLRTIKNVLLEANLRMVATPEQTAAVLKLIRQEEQPVM